MEAEDAKKLHRAKYWTKLDAGSNDVQCRLCPRNCVIRDSRRGFCGVRKNIGGILYSLVYGKAVSLHVDPIEKKPLYHFYPGTEILSFGTIGCNLACKFCQNWEISKAKPEEYPVEDVTPEQIVQAAIDRGCRSIAYTYTEPTIFFEYVLDTAKLARKRGIKNVLVTNGYMNEEPFNELYRYIDAANVDLKAFTQKFYADMASSRLQPVLDTLKRIVDQRKKGKINTWLEITNLIIPGLNDSFPQIEKMCGWINENLGDDVPLHFSKFFPMYMAVDRLPTPKETLVNAYKAAKRVGLKYVYIGNLWTEKEDDTYCQKCRKLLISRIGMRVEKNIIKNGRCPECGELIAGVWDDAGSSAAESAKQKEEETKEDKSKEPTSAEKCGKIDEADEGVIARCGIKKKHGYLYYIDKNGNIACTKMNRKGRKKKKI